VLSSCDCDAEDSPEELTVGELEALAQRRAEEEAGAAARGEVGWEGWVVVRGWHMSVTDACGKLWRWCLLTGMR